jgi:hypothetical protein
MENTTATQFTNDIDPAPARPQFLKVLCILTWIACGLTFVSTVMGMFGPSAEKQQQQIEQMREMNPEMADQMEVAINADSGSQKMISSLLSIIAVVLSAYGAMMMWQLKKTGFYVYLLGELIPYITLFMVGAQAMSAVGAMAGMAASAMMGIVIAIMLVLDLIFIIMYAVNLKHMK